MKLIRRPFPLRRPPCLRLLFAALGLVATPARAELIYDNSGTSLNTFVSRLEEFGDEIDFAGSARTITEMTFQVFGERDLPDGASARFRLYRLNGPALRPPFPAVPSPGELVYQSPSIRLQAGAQPIRITDLAIDIPSRTVWTVEFQGTTSRNGERAGLQVYHPPLVGRSFRDYWVRDTAGFTLFVLDGGVPANFAARFLAQPDPAVEFTTSQNPSGQTVLRVTGPIGSDQVVEVSNDLGNWRTLALVSLATNAVGTLTDPETPSPLTRYYRTRPSPHPGQSVLIQSIRLATNGAATLTLTGPRGSETFLEASSDRRNWATLGLLRFTGTTATYTDSEPAGAGPIRFYRTRRPSGHDPILVLQKIEKRGTGVVLLTCLGTPGTQGVAVEASPDLVTWTPIGTIRFDTPEATYLDAFPPAGTARFYRLRQ